MGFLSGIFGGGKADDGGVAAAQAEALRKNQAETDRLNAEAAATKEEEDKRRRQIAAGLLGRKSLFSAGETGFERSSTLGAS